MDKTKYKDAICKECKGTNITQTLHLRNEDIDSKEIVCEDCGFRRHIFYIEVGKHKTGRYVYNVMTNRYEEEIVMEPVKPPKAKLKLDGDFDIQLDVKSEDSKKRLELWKYEGVYDKDLLHYLVKSFKDIPSATIEVNTTQPIATLMAITVTVSRSVYYDYVSKYNLSNKKS